MFLISVFVSNTRALGVCIFVYSGDFLSLALQTMAEDFELRLDQVRTVKVVVRRERLGL